MKWLPLLFVSSIAGAGPIASAALDLDGDGASDKLELSADGTLSIIASKAGTQKVPLGKPTPVAQLRAAIVRGTPTVIVETPPKDQAFGEAIVLERGASGWKEKMRQPVGGVGLDHDYAVELDARPEGIYRYQSRPGYERCDGGPGYLFAEGYDPAHGKFAKVIPPIGVADTAPVLIAKIDGAPSASPVLYQARVASTQPGAGDAGGLGVPRELDDGRLDTAWREDLGGDGKGQFFSFVPRMPTAKAKEIRIVPGTPTSPSAFKATNRPHRIAIVGKGVAWWVELPDALKEPLGTAYVIELPQAVDGCVSVILDTTYKGDKDTTAIAELEVFADGERAGGGDAVLAHAIAEGKDGARNAAQAIARRGAAGAAAIDAELAKTSDDDARARLVEALLAINDPATGPILVHAVKEKWVIGRDLIDAISALGRLKQGQALHDLAGAGNVTLEARIAAVHALDEPALLVDLAGDGPRDLRHAIIEVLTNVDTKTLIAAAQADSSAPAAGDLWRAVTRRAHAMPAERATALAAMTAALKTSTDYERRYRLIDGIAAIGDKLALAELDTLLRGLPVDAERAAFEQIAARAIAVNPRPEALDLLVHLVVEPDPGVRLAAITALAGTEGGTGGPWHAPEGPDAIDRVLVTSLHTDTWPEVRRRAAQVLGDRCMRPGPAHALAESIGRDPELGVKIDALAALVECKAPVTAELLPRIWDDHKAAVELRQKAVDLSVTLGDRQLGQKLVAKLAAWRGAALENADALALAQNAAYAIGRLAPPGAAEALMAALEDSAYPEIVAAAATGLGLMGPGCPAAARTKLRVLARSEEQQIQLAASRAVAQCK